MATTRFLFHPRQKHIVNAILSFMRRLVLTGTDSNRVYLDRKKICPTSNKTSYYNVLTIMENRNWIKSRKVNNHYVHTISWSRINADFGTGEQSLFTGSQSSIYGTLGDVI